MNQTLVPFVKVMLLRHSRHYRRRAQKKALEKGKVLTEEESQKKPRQSIPTQQNVKMNVTACSLTMKNLMEKIGGNVHYNPPEKRHLFLVPVGEGAKEGDPINFILPTIVRKAG